MSDRSISLEWVIAGLMSLGAILVLVGQVAESKVLQVIGGLMVYPILLVMLVGLVGVAVCFGLKSVFHRWPGGTHGASSSVEDSAGGTSSHDKDLRQ